MLAALESWHPKCCPFGCFSPRSVPLCARIPRMHILLVHTTARWPRPRSHLQRVLQTKRYQWRRLGWPADKLQFILQSTVQCRARQPYQYYQLNIIKTQINLKRRSNRSVDLSREKKMRRTVMQRCLIQNTSLLQSFLDVVSESLHTWVTDARMALPSTH